MLYEVITPEFSSVAGLREQVRTWLAWNRLEQSDLFKLMTDRQKKYTAKLNPSSPMPMWLFSAAAQQDSQPASTLPRRI